MKAILKVVLVLGVFALAYHARAQSTLTPAEYNALVQAVENTTPQPASAAPKFGNFYTITHGENWPPLPADTMGLSFYDLGGNVYLLDDRGFNYDARQAQSTARSRMFGDFEPDFTPQYTSDQLWLELQKVTNGVTSLVIHAPTTNNAAYYDLLYETNPTALYSWRWILRTSPGQTNIAVTNAFDAQGFYRLGASNDLTANDSLGTSFWLAFPGMYNDGNNALSLYISSPVGASGTVTIANQTNGSSVTVTGDPSVDGTYILTNITIIPFHYYNGSTGLPLSSLLVTNAYIKGSLVIFFDNNYADGAGWVLADTNNIIYSYYGLYGVRNLNEVTWYMGAGNPTSLAASCAEYPSIQQFSVSALSGTNVLIPNYIMMADYDTVEAGRAINVTASAPVSVYGFENDPQLSAAFTAYPTPLLGTNYCVMAHAGAPKTLELDPGGNSQLTIVATVDETMVTITPSSTANLASGHSTAYTTNLNQGEAYQIDSSGYTGDVTGTFISATKPIAVFAGAYDAFVPNAVTGSDNPLIQEQIPVDDWGANVLAFSFDGRTGGDSYRVLPAQSGTDIYTNGVLAATNLQAGMPYDAIIDSNIQFTANRPIQVAQFANGRILDNALNGDPCEILLPNTDHYLETNIIFSIGTNGADFVYDYLNIIVPQSATNSAFLDGTNLSVANFAPFAPIGSSGYYGAQILVTNTAASHTVTSSQPVGVEVYGWGPADAYGYFGGVVK